MTSKELGFQEGFYHSRNWYKWLTMPKLFVQMMWFMQNTYFRFESLDFQHILGRGYLYGFPKWNSFALSLMLSSCYYLTHTTQVAARGIKYLLCDSTGKGISEAHSWFPPDLASWAYLCWFRFISFAKIKLSHCAVKNLTFSKERSRLCPWLLGGNLWHLEISCMIKVSLFTYGRWTTPESQIVIYVGLQVTWY